MNLKPRSFIAQNASAILDGTLGRINLTNNTSDFFWIGVDGSTDDDRGNAKQVMEQKYARMKGKLVACVAKLYANGQDMHDVQILCPTYKGPVGVNALNQLIQAEFNPHGAIVYKGREHALRIGDKVMQTKNDYDKDVFNGDQGTVVAGGPEGIVVNFDGREVEYGTGEATDLALSYVMTIHKAQGSESRSVIQILTTSHYTMLQRSLFYTGVTRARERCYLIGERKAVILAVRNNPVAHRNTALADFLRRIKEDNQSPISSSPPTA